MKNSTRSLIAIAVLAAAGAVQAQGITIVNPKWQYAPPSIYGLQVERPDGEVGMTITQNGDVQFESGSTIAFSGTTLPRAGICVGFIPIRLNGDLMLIPVYKPFPGDTFPPEYEVTKPYNGYHKRNC